MGAIHSNSRSGLRHDRPQRFLVGWWREVASEAAADTAPESYQVAVGLYGEGKTTEARAAFEAIIASWDTTENRGNADFGTVLGGSHYHLGEILFAEDRHAEAAEHYQAVIDFFVTYRVESYYHLGLGRLYRKDYSGALQTLGELVASYPTATLAAQVSRVSENCTSSRH